MPCQSGQKKHGKWMKILLQPVVPFPDRWAFRVPGYYPPRRIQLSPFCLQERDKSYVPWMFRFFSVALYKFSVTSHSCRLSSYNMAAASYAKLLRTLCPRVLLANRLTCLTVPSVFSNRHKDVLQNQRTRFCSSVPRPKKET